MSILKKLSNENGDNQTTLREPKRKTLLRPLSDRKKTIEKIEIECDIDKIDDNEYINSLSPNEILFYRKQASALFNFLSDINLVRFIEDFIQDGFESENDLLLIKEDYFDENKSFNKVQQKRILDKVKELAKRKENIPKKETCEFGTNTVGETIKSLHIIRCWNCLREVSNTNGIVKDYLNGFITERINFCSEKCMKDFEKKVIYVQCDKCLKHFDKAKGDFVVGTKHFCSKNCINDYLIENNQTQLLHNESDDDNNYQYDPMEDF